jgi:DNA replication protein DnaC
MLITATNHSANGANNLPGLSPMTLAAIDRLVYHATILEMNVDSYRRKEAVAKTRGD